MWRFARLSQSDIIVILWFEVGCTAMKVELVTTLKRQATKVLAQLHESKEPILITEHGKPSAYLLDVADYEHMVNRMKILEGIARGEQALREGRVVSHEDAKERMAKWLK